MVVSSSAAAAMTTSAASSALITIVSHKYVFSVGMREAQKVIVASLEIIVF